MSDCEDASNAKPSCTSGKNSGQASAAHGKLRVPQSFTPGHYIVGVMLSQIVVHTNAHPYHIQVISFWLSLGPVIVMLALLVFVQYWRLKRSRRKSRPPVR